MEMEKIYRHSSPGFTLPLWLDEKPIKQKSGKANAVFKDTGSGIDRCGIFRTYEENVSKAIEQSKAFKTKAVVRLKSDDEIRLETVKAERAKYRKDVIKQAEKGLFNFETLKKMKQKELHEFAVSIDVDVSTGKGVRTNASILSEITEMLFPNKEEEKDE